MIRRILHRTISIARKINPIGLLLVIYFMTFAWFTTFGEMGLMAYHSLYDTRHDFEEKIAAKKSEIADLQLEKENLKNPRYIESVIRKELGYVKADEVVFKIVSE